MKKLFLSTDKASSPINSLTNLLQINCFQQVIHLMQVDIIQFFCSKIRQRYDSRGSLRPFFTQSNQEDWITDVNMTRFMISLEQGIDLVWHAFNDMLVVKFMSKIPSMKVTNIAKIAPKANHKIIGIRPGEKHEQMISVHDTISTYEYDRYYKILPQINEWTDNERIKMGKK